MNHHNVLGLRNIYSEHKRKPDGHAGGTAVPILVTTMSTATLLEVLKPARHSFHHRAQRELHKASKLLGIWTVQ